MDYAALILTCLKPLIAIGLPFAILPLLIVMERRGAAFIQDRPGPNRAGINLSLGNILGALLFKESAIKAIFSATPPVDGVRLRGFGLIFNATDGIKGFFKQSFTPPFAHRWYYIIAPALPICTALLSTAILPWFGPITFNTPNNGITTVSGQALDADAGLLVLFAIGSLGVYGIVLGSWASNSKFSLLGGMRASAMMISYEVSMGLSALGVILLVGSFDLTAIVAWQTEHTWGIVAQPIGFLLFFTAIFAECNRTPFDVIEGDSEIVAGFHTEYGSGKFLAFMSGEYTHVVVASALVATLFLGGYSLLPFPLPLNGLGESWVSLNTLWLRDHLGLMGAIVLAGMGVLALGFAWLVNKRRVWYGTLIKATDRTARVREYGFYSLVFALAGLGFLLAAGIAAWLGNPTALAGIHDKGAPVHALWVGLAVAAIQVGVVMGKTFLLSWVFVWVRWTLPRFRYDQIMALGWKVLLNLAILNLLITAVLVKAFGGHHG